ncbi:MAG: quercetin 2,3-dioxygenase [Bdellovibrionales bacterium CG10_big_fil_rev_8_21_14_0_10_45_34]|nr:MAG: quercetin 2,3-dioxygenase [Bdellovibrionales bacterium CG10_big_fil_rev_8_21_14_0_10_45_34]
MIELRKSKERGYFDHGWLKTRHTFSFADYKDPDFMGFRSLRVINEDQIEGGTGFGSHPHKNMEIISVAVEGALKHKDSMGNEAVIKPGEIQKMSAGTGVVHSEHNNFSDQVAHFLQIWIIPKTQGGVPSYGQKSFEQELRTGNLVLVVSENGRNGSIDIKQDCDMYWARSQKGTNFHFQIRIGRAIWLQVIKGSLSVNAQTLEVGDGARVVEESDLQIEPLEDSEFLLFDLA